MARGMRMGRRAAVLAVLCVMMLTLVLAVSACGGSSTSTTGTTRGGSSTSTTAAGGPTTTAAPPTTTGPGDASTTPTSASATTTISLPSTLNDADKAFVQALGDSITSHTQELLDLGAFMVAYESASDAAIAKAEEDVSKLAIWVDGVKAMTPSEGLKGVHQVLSQALTEYVNGFTAFVAAVKSKDDAQIRAAMTVISEASRKYQSFGQAFGGLVK